MTSLLLWFLVGGTLVAIALLGILVFSFIKRIEAAEIVHDLGAIQQAKNVFVFLALLIAIAYAIAFLIVVFGSGLVG